MRKGISTMEILLGVLVVGLIFIGYKTVMTPQSVIDEDGGPTVVQTGPGFAVTVKTSGYDPIASSLTAVNGELWDSNDNQIVGETSVASALTALSSSAPNDFDGYIMIGNDNYQSGTDRGTEYYYTKKKVGWRNHGGDISFEKISTPAEGTPTWSGYDDGTLEATTNITIGSGATVTSTELKIQASDNAYLGNPSFSRPLAVCFNATGSGVGGNTGHWDEVRPTNYDSSFTPPDFLSGYNIIGKCYVLPTEALKDYFEYRFFVILDAASGQNPASGNSVYAILLDKSYCLNDDNKWIECWGDDSDQGTDQDVGLDSIGNVKQIALN